MVFSTRYCVTGEDILDSAPFSVRQNNRYNPILSSYEKTFGLCFGLLCSKNTCQEEQFLRRYRLVEGKASENHCEFIL